MNIAVIGVGQIGSRHLQALAKLEQPALVQIVDPSEKSLEIAKQRFFEVYSDGSVRVELSLHKDIGKLYDPIDIGIVATSSDVRADVVKEFVQTKQVKNLILEKILFQKVRDYFEVNEMLKAKSIHTWVNCWMRTADFYRNIKTRLCERERIRMSIEGSFWGIGCKGIHFLDLFSYLTDCKDFYFVSCELDKKIIDSKRVGFKEFTGKLAGCNSKGHHLTFVCYNSGDKPLTIEILSNSQKHKITFCDGYNMLYNAVCGEAELIEKVPMPLQSQMTRRLVHRLIKDGNCDLPAYDDSKNLHLSFIKVLLGHLQTLTTEKVNICPIT